MNSESQKITPKEAMEILAVLGHKRALEQIITLLVEQNGKTNEKEQRWWDKVTKRLNLDPSERHRVNVFTGEITCKSK